MPAVDDRDGRHLAPLAGPHVLQHRPAATDLADEDAQLAAHAGLLQAGVGRCEVSGERQQRAGDLVGGGQRHPAAGCREPLRNPDRDRAADGVVHQHVAVRQARRAVPQDVDHVEDARRIVDGRGVGTGQPLGIGDVRGRGCRGIAALGGPGTGREDHVGARGAGGGDVLRADLGAQVDPGTEAPALRLEPVGEQPEALPAGAHGGDRQHASGALGPVGDADPVAARGEHPAGLQAGRTGPDHEDLAGPAVAAGLGRLAGLVTAARLADAADDRVAVVPDLAGLVAQQARPDALRRAFAQPGEQLRVGDAGPRHLHQVGGPVVEGVLGLGRLDDAALKDHRHPAAGGRAHLPAQVVVEARRHVRGGPVGGGGERPAAHHDEQVEGAGHRGHLIGGLLGRDAGPRCELVTGQPQPQHAPRAQLGADRGDHLAGQPQPVGAVAVAPQVGQAGVELPQQPERAGVQLDAVEPGRHGEPGARRETGDDLVDLLLLHLRR